MYVVCSQKIHYGAVSLASVVIAGRGEGQI